MQTNGRTVKQAKARKTNKRWPKAQTSSPTDGNNFEPTFAIGVVLVSLLLTLTYFTLCSSVSIVDFEQVIAGWVIRVNFQNNDGNPIAAEPDYNPQSGQPNSDDTMIRDNLRPEILLKKRP